MKAGRMRYWLLAAIVVAAQVVACNAPLEPPAAPSGETAPAAIAEGPTPTPTPVDRGQCQNGHCG